MTDIVARLQLRAEQFSSETGARFAELKTRARSAASEVRESFGSAFAEVQKLAQTSLQLPRTDTGSLNLGPEIAQLNAAASAADQRAQALRELSIAQTAAAASANVDAAALRLEADASAVAALAEERNADAIRQRVLSLEAVQRELNQTTSETRRLTAAEEEAHAAARRGSGNFTMFGQQLGDFTVQVVSGQSALIAFAQQFPQATYALSTMGGAAGKVGAFLTGPWGTALTIAVVALTPFVGKLLEASDAAKLAKDASEDLAKYVGDLGNYFDLTTGKIKQTNQALIQYAILSNYNENKDKRKVMEQARQTGNAALRDSLTPQAQYGAGPAGGVAVFAPNPVDRSLANVFAGGPNAPGIDARLRAIAASGNSNSALAKQILESRATYFKTAQEIAKNDKEIQSLLTGVLDPDLKTGKGKKPPKPKKAPDLQPMSDSSEEMIARINAEWNEQPKLIDKAFLETQKLDNLIGRLSTKRPPNFEKLIADAEAAKATIERGLITAIGRAFEEPKTLAQKGAEALGELDTIIADLEKRRPPNFEQMVDQAERTKGLIETGMVRPFTEFVRQQRESLAVGELVLAGRDAEAEALRSALDLQERLGRALRDDELATVLQLAEQHERIARALEDQRRIVGIYTGAVGELQDTFDQFLKDLDGNTGSALKGLINGVISDIKQLQRDLLSNALFGGIDRKIEDYIRQITGKKTPAEILSDQARDAGVELRARVTSSGDALADFTRMVRATTSALGGNSGIGGIGSAGSAAGLLTAAGSGIAGSVAEVLRGLGHGASHAANDNSDEAEIVVTGQRLKEGAGELVKASSVLGIAIDGFASNLDKLGVHVPKVVTDALKKGLPTVFEGISFGQLGGSVFSSITGGKDNKVASSIGGVLGEIAGKSLAKPIAGLIGGTLGKTLGGAAGPIGSIVGGILGNVIGGLFNKPQYGTAILTNATDKVSASGRGSSSISAASGLAGSVQQGLTQLADQLGATLGNFDTVVGMFDGKYRVRTTAAGWDGKGPLDYKGNSGNNLYDFGDDQQAAIQFAIADAVRDGAIQGLSAASSRILQSGQDLAKAVEKVTMIESIPKDLKAMLDPVGAAVDALNLKWKRTVDALKEGGATAEQMAQAQRLYDLQLQQTLNSTASASQTLKDFRDSLMLGSNSPYSLRDQEATALSKLQPFLDQINAGQSVDQDKYRAAAEAYLSVERDMYGSTQDYFKALDTVQAATNKAISAIDNVAPISPAIESPFAKATADSSATTAANTGTTNELLEQVSNQLSNLNDNLLNLGIVPDTGFIGEGRLFNKSMTY